MKTISRRKALAGLLPGTTLMVIASPGTQQLQHRKVQWLKLTTEPLGPGDMWASCDPNTPERQIGQNYNLQMQAVNNDQYGKPPGDNLGNGWHYRPIAIVGC